jgi:hypothetical protein
MEKFNPETYVPKGDLIDVPIEVIAKMLERQVEQGNKEDVSVFENSINGGFDWDKSKEGKQFWTEVLMYDNFNHFFEKYPKQEEQPQEEHEYFYVGQAVWCSINGECVVVEVDYSKPVFPITVKIKSTGGHFNYTKDGRVYKNSIITLSQNPIPPIVNAPIKKKVYMSFNDAIQACLEGKKAGNDEVLGFGEHNYMMLAKSGVLYRCHGKETYHKVTASMVLSNKWYIIEP